MSKKPKSPAPPAKSKSFIRTKEEQQKIMEARHREEAALIAHIEALFARMDREDAKATARARAQAKAQNLSPEETEALIKQAIQGLARVDKPKSHHAWQKGAKLAPVPNAEELRSGLSRLLGIGKRD
ncbi:hypothetical protein [Aquidulcibacter sp.]|uniref:hypothetical protein n=1 Tax=Aquidulcibacter sp. TaxID=2052990 RepID=UPI0025C119E5|nr:hypothetical protein [Aquidulcibacter sp.]MCA3694773.1 hypothetical protein [Aquidulcibacter sp.]